MMRGELSPLPRAANENWAARELGEDRSFCAPEAAQTPPPAAAVAERTALAMLRCGVSFMDAAQSSGLPVKRVMALWNEQRDWMR